MELHEKNATYTFFIHKFPKKKEPRWTQTKEIVQIEWDHLDYYWKQLISFICETVQSNGMLKIWTRFAQKAFVKEMNILRCNWKYMHAFFSSLALFLFSLALFSPRGPSIINYSRNSSLSMELIDRPADEFGYHSLVFVGFLNFCPENRMQWQRENPAKTNVDKKNEVRLKSSHEIAIR